MPFAFEVGAALGDESEDLLREAAKVAEHCRRGVGDLRFLTFESNHIKLRIL